MSIYALLVLFVTFAASALQYSVLGPVWPIVYRDLGVALSLVGYVNMIIAAGRGVSSFRTDGLVRKYGTWRVASCGFALICLGILGYANCRSFAMLCLSSLPLGLGEGLFICSINVFSAVHLRAKYVNWLNMVFSVGVTAGTYLMSRRLSQGAAWNAGYLTLAVIQLAVLALFLSSYPQWREIPQVEFQRAGEGELPGKPSGGRKGMPVMMVASFCYVAVETTSALWSSSYLTIRKGLPAEVGVLGTTFLFVGMTVGRLVSGFISDRLGDRRMMHIGQGLIVAGGLALFLLAGSTAALASMAVLGLGCAPLHPCFIHYIPRVFGVEQTGSAISLIVGVSQLATLLMPVVFGWIADLGGMWLYPLFLMLFAVLMMAMIRISRESAAASQDG